MNVSHETFSMRDVLTFQTISPYKAANGMAGATGKWKPHEVSHARWASGACSGPNQTRTRTAAAGAGNDTEGKGGQEKDQWGITETHREQPAAGEGAWREENRWHETETRKKGDHWSTETERNGWNYRKEGGMFQNNFCCNLLYTEFARVDI